MVVGSTLTEDFPALPADALVAVPARWDEASGVWTVELEFLARPPGYGALEAKGRGSRTVIDAPCGLDMVELHVRFRRWRSLTGGQSVSPLPAWWGDAARLKYTPELRAYLAGSRTMPGLSRRTAQRAVGGSAELLTTLLAQSTSAPAPEPADYRLRRAEPLPRILAVDEIYLGGRYWTVLTDNDQDEGAPRHFRQRFLGICLGRDVAVKGEPPSPLQRMLGELASWYREDRSRWDAPRPGRPDQVTLDLWSGHVQAFKEAFLPTPRRATYIHPPEFLVPDAFHLTARGHRVRTMTLAHFWRKCTMAERAQLERCGHTPQAAATCKCAAKSKCDHHRRLHALNAVLDKIGHARSTKEWWDFRVAWYLALDRARKYGTISERGFMTLADDLSRRVDDPQRRVRSRVKGAKLGVPRSNVWSTNARAERMNRELRAVMQGLGRRNPALILDRLMVEMGRDPVGSAPGAVTMLAGSLECPGCGGRVSIPSDALVTPIPTLPRGMQPLNLKLPTQVQCDHCGRVTLPLAQLPRTPQLDRWLQAPGQLALPRRVLAQLTGLKGAALPSHKAMITRLAEQTEGKARAAGERDLETLIYDEIWTTTRVWLLLATPAGQLVDMQLVPSPVPSKKPSHEAVGTAAADFLTRHVGGQQTVVLNKEYRALMATLAGPLRARKVNVILSSYVLHEYHRRFWNKLLKELETKREKSGSKAPVVNRGKELDLERRRRLQRENAGGTAAGQEEAGQPHLHGRSQLRREAFTWLEQERDSTGSALTIHEANAFWASVNGLAQTEAGEPTTVVLQELTLFKRLLSRNWAGTRALLDTAGVSGPTGGRSATSLDPQTCIEQFYARRAHLPDRWQAWRAVRPLITATLLTPPVSMGRHPRLLSRITGLLRSSPSLDPDVQRERILRVEAHERAGGHARAGA